MELIGSKIKPIRPGITGLDPASVHRRELFESPMYFTLNVTILATSFAFGPNTELALDSDSQN
jgi:hypothetical protein